MFTKPWLKVLSGLFVNFAAALFAAPLIGGAISFPQSIADFAIIAFDISFGIIFILLAVWCEKEFENG